MHSKKNLPEKICPVCLRPFSWRKKWQRNWESVRYCSNRCRNHRGRVNTRSETTLPGRKYGRQKTVKR